MLSDRLKDRTLFVTVEEVDIGRTKQALDMLEECVDNLVLLMRTIETEGLLPREDVEEYVISYIESYEKRYYGLEEDKFDKFMRDYLKRG